MSLYERATTMADHNIVSGPHIDLFGFSSDANMTAGHSSLVTDALDHLPAGLAVFDAELRMVYCNKVLREMLDYPPQLFAFGAPTMEQIFRSNAERGEYGTGSVEDFVASRLALARKREPHVYERRRPNGNVLEVRGVPLDNGGFATIYLDVSPQKVANRTPTASDLGDADKLTGLPNAKSVQRFISNCLRLLKHGEKACITTIDLTHFSEVNEQHGRVVGDFVLREIAIRLSSTIRGSDYLGRTGGDRFTIVHPIILRPSDPARLAGRLMSEIKRPISCGSRTIVMSAYVGFTLVDSTNLDIDEIMMRSKESLMRERTNRGL